MLPVLFPDRIDNECDCEFKSTDLDDDFGSLLALDEEDLLVSVFFGEVVSLWVSLSTFDEGDLMVRLTATVSDLTELMNNRIEDDPNMMNTFWNCRSHS